MDTQETTAINLDIPSMLKASEEQIRQKVIAGAVAAYSEQLGWELESQIKKGVETFFDEEVMPELRKEMLAAKPQILLSIKAGLLKTAEALGEALYQKAAKNLDSYSGREAMQKLFS